MDHHLIPQYYTWEERGKTYTQITAPTKRAILAEYAKKYKLRTFVETGTCEGDTILALQPLFDRCYTVELWEAKFKEAKANLAHFGNSVSVFHGNSEDVLPQILYVLGVRPTLFWLDAHGENWIGPIVQELEAIFASSAIGVILIDDMDFITDTLPESPNWKKSEEYGIVRLVHESLA